MKKITNSLVVAWIMITKLINHTSENGCIRKKSYDGETKWKYFSIEVDELLEIYNSIWKKLAIILKKNLLENPSTITKILQTNKRSYGMTLQIFMINKMPKTGSKKIKPIIYKCCSMNVHTLYK